MRKIILVILFILSVLMVGCDCKTESNMSTENVKKIKEEGSKTKESFEQKKYNHSMSNKEELINMLTGDQTKNIKDGAFADLVDLYKNQYKYILVPSVQGIGANSIFVDSYRNYINYVFKHPSIRICIEPINNKKNKEYDTTDICKYIEQKYNVEFNKKQDIPLEEQVNFQGQNTGYEYNSFIYVTKTVEFKDGKQNCALKKKESKKSDTEYTLSFIKDEMIVNIFYYNTQCSTINFKELKELQFEKVVLK